MAHNPQAAAPRPAGPQAVHRRGGAVPDVRRRDLGLDHTGESGLAVPGPEFSKPKANPMTSETPAAIKMTCPGGTTATEQKPVDEVVGPSPSRLLRDRTM